MTSNIRHHRPGLAITSLVFLVFLSACHPTYDPPARLVYETNSRIIDASADKVWAVVIENIAKSFFVINNIERSSGYINISYSGDPESYVDCGTAHFHNLTTDYDFAVASNKVKLPSALRQESLEGRANLLLRPTLEGKTSFYVNVRYVMHEHYVPESIDGMFGTNQDYQTSSVFDTGHSGSFGKYTCRPTGALEKRLLDLAPAE